MRLVGFVEYLIFRLSCCPIDVVFRRVACSPRLRGKELSMKKAMIGLAISGRSWSRTFPA